MFYSIINDNWEIFLESAPPPHNTMLLSPHKAGGGKCVLPNREGVEIPLMIGQICRNESQQQTILPS